MGFYANIKMLEREDVFRHFFCNLSKERQQKIEAVRAADGRRSSLGAWTLVDYGLQQLYGLCGREVSIGYGAHGKPYVENEPDIHFNLSHSGDYALAAFAPVEIGCDIQQTADCGQITGGARDGETADCAQNQRTPDCARNGRIAARFFTEKEQQALAAGMDFYRIWARKESYIKCTGDGMACDLRSFDVVADFERAREADAIPDANMDAAPQPSDIHGTKIYFAEHTLPGYAMAVCYQNRAKFSVVWREVILK